ncbi:MAG TPA: cell division protein FtsH, partial [Bdellovibrionota bacterium]|nr:cell division protein FtsH [Bdellovibrionota bacterium]
PIHKVTIIPRGMALGLTHQMPTEDKYTLNQDFAETTIAIMMGGRVAEELVFGRKTNGAGNDIEKATELARKMVCEWGMSDKMGPLTFGKKEEEIFLARDIWRTPNYSERTAQLIDDEIRQVVLRNYERAKGILTQKRDVLDRLADALLEYEVLEGEEVSAIIEGRPFQKKKIVPSKPGQGTSQPAETKSVIPGLLGKPEPAMGFVGAEPKRRP